MCNILLVVTIFLTGASNFLIVSSNGSVESSSFPGPYLIPSETGPNKHVSFSKSGPVITEFIPLARAKRQAPEQSTTAGKGAASSDKETKAAAVVPPTPAAPAPAVNNNGNASSTPAGASSATAVVLPTVPPSVVAANVTNATAPVSTNSTSPAVPAANQTISFDDEIDKDFPNYPEYRAQNNKNLTVQNETQKYYNVTLDPKGEQYWIDLSVHPNASRHEMLSNAHRRAATLKLSFQFPFYGHLVENVTIATGGFVYLGEQVHAWLAATQYVAPLMANFDSSLSDNATVQLLSNDQQCTIEWNRVHLKDNPEIGPFTFQTSLFKNGTIVFAYKLLPINVLAINDTTHPVKVGLSDAFIRDKNVLLFKQKTIYEYDRIEYKGKSIGNGTAIIFTPLPTCLSFNTCTDCSRHNSTFECSWCHSAGRCSDGTDRYRHDWISKGCEHTNTTTCDSSGSNTPKYSYDTTTSRDGHSSHGRFPDDHVNKSPITQPGEEGMSAAGVIGILFLVMMIVTGAGWVFYAYLFPHSASGQLLIRYRPSQWTFRRGEARYTAASIHM